MATTTLKQSTQAGCGVCVHRVLVRPKPDQPDPVAEQVLPLARSMLGNEVAVRTGRVYLIEAPLTDAQLIRVAQELLADPVSQYVEIGTEQRSQGQQVIEVHLQLGVMDPVAQSTRDAIVEMLPDVKLAQVQVRTGWWYDIRGSQASAQQLRQFAQANLANPVIQQISLDPVHPKQFEHGSQYKLNVTHVPIRALDDAGLIKLSKQGHLFLNLEEMRSIRAYFKQAQREPTDVELETLAQTWSEHCVHKTLKATIRYTQPHSDRADAGPCPKDWADRPGHELHDDGSITITNLLKSTIAAATSKLMAQPPHLDWCISVFEDNAGIVRFDEDDAVCIKVETHNHPSAIEPYGGAATGVGGCIRDIMGTGLSAKPIANTDVFCVAPADIAGQQVPKGVIAPKRVLEQVVAGVRDYGNRMGVPTVNGAVWFHKDYIANPLVFVGCVGIIPLDRCFGKAQPGDRIIALGGRTGRDGIHGATFSSDQLTDTHADQFAHAVQIGNAITQKKTLDVILQARDVPEQQGGPLFNGITDCGAGGFSSAVGEMGQELGARVTLDTAPLKYQGLSYTETWISEAQERMVLAVPAKKVDRLRQLCQAQDVEMCDLGEFGARADDGQPELILTYLGTQVGRLSMGFLHDGMPTPTRLAAWAEPKYTPTDQPDIQEGGAPAQDIPGALYQLLGHPNIASKHWIIRQYDHEVQGGSVIKPLMGPGQDGPCDAAVIRPKLTSQRGIAISSGLTPGLGEKALNTRGDSYWMALAAIDEAVRNCVCVGADPSRIAILDNFCWPRCDDPAQLGSLVRAAQGCYDGALAYQTPFVSGKDSLSNQFCTQDGNLIKIPPTLLITGLGIVSDVACCCTMDAKAAGNLLLIVGQTTTAMGGSHFGMVADTVVQDQNIPHVDLGAGPQTAQAVSSLMANQLIASAHDCSDGGLLIAAAEMAFAGRVGLELDLSCVPMDQGCQDVTVCFAETPSRYLLEVKPDKLGQVIDALAKAGVVFGQIGSFVAHDRLTVRGISQDTLISEVLDDLRRAWLQPLDW